MTATERAALADRLDEIARSLNGPIGRDVNGVLGSAASALRRNDFDPLVEVEAPTESAPALDLPSDAPSALSALAAEIDQGNMEDRSWMIDALERAADLLREDRRASAGRPDPKVPAPPVVDAIAAGRKPLIIDEHVVSVPLTDEATHALHEWIGNNLDGLAEALAPHGLHPNDIQKPNYTRVVYEDDLYPRRWMIGIDPATSDTITFAETQAHIGRLMHIPTDNHLSTALAVLLDRTDVVLIGALRESGAETIIGLELGGRINKSTERRETLYLLNADGAAGIISELLGLAGRADPNFLEQLLDRIAELPRKDQS